MYHSEFLAELPPHITELLQGEPYKSLVQQGDRNLGDEVLFIRKNSLILGTIVEKQIVRIWGVNELDVRYELKFYDEHGKPDLYLLNSKEINFPVVTQPTDIKDNRIYWYDQPKVAQFLLGCIANINNINEPQNET